MATITIRDLDESIKMKLRLVAAEHGCSMEEEARRILRSALTPQGKKSKLGSKIHQRFAKIGGIDLQPPSRSAPRSAPDFTGNEE